MKRLILSASACLILFFAANIPAFSADGAALYKEHCAGCHGADGKQGGTPLKGQSAGDLLKKLDGYADGTYGGSNKTVMQGIVKKLAAEDKKTVADYIGTL